ncbi:hypothetical protein CR970_01225 [Candidatus Saccharibacteria bacterium]|nr:MAG: hypothetical protein CR970_01225 [Candidatus Saccharibacteria bacterium]
MKVSVSSRSRPKQGFAHYAHVLLNVLLALLVYVFVQIGIVPLAIGMVLLSKWRMFALRPRYWLLNLRSNAVDIIVGLSFVAFMLHTLSPGLRALLAVAYAGWLVLLKPRSSAPMIGLQALAGQALGLWSLFLVWKDAPLVGLVFVVWLISYLSARHYFSTFDEMRAPMFAHVWGYFGAALTWVLGRWLIFYGQIAQPTLIMTVLGFGMASLYYLDHQGRLSSLVRRQFVFIMVAIVVVILVFSGWGDVTIRRV